MYVHIYRRYAHDRLPCETRVKDASVAGSYTLLQLSVWLPVFHFLNNRGAHRLSQYSSLLNCHLRDICLFLDTKTYLMVLFYVSSASTIACRYMTHQRVL